MKWISHASVVAPVLALQSSFSPQTPTNKSPIRDPRSTSSAVKVIEAPRDDPDKSFGLGPVAFSLLPLAGTTTRRATIETTVVPGSVWTHDQLQGVVNVNVPVRSTVIKLRAGGLWIHNPVAPTGEYMGMIRALETVHGPVKHIVLGSLGLEHKALAGPFAAKFPNAQVWLQPGQWSFPVELPSALFGFNPRNTKTLPTAAQDRAWAEAAGTGGGGGVGGGQANASSALLASASPPWRDEIDFEVLGPLKFKAVGAFGEAAFLHKASQTLLVTDAVVKVDEEPPAIVQEDPRALLFHARDSVAQELADSSEARRKGWRRIVQFGLIFFPSSIDVTPFAEAVRGALGLGGSASVAPSMRGLGEGAVPAELYPWSWTRDDEPSFKALQRSGGNSAGLLVAPILQKLILNREPEAVLDWVERIAGTPAATRGASHPLGILGNPLSSFLPSQHTAAGTATTTGRGPGKLRNFKRIIPCHLSNNVRATPADFQKAFSFLRQQEQEEEQQRQREEQSHAAASPRHPADTGPFAARAGAAVGKRENGLASWLGLAPQSDAARHGSPANSAKPEDLQLLESASSLLSSLGVVAPAKV